MKQTIFTAKRLPAESSRQRVLEEEVAFTYTNISDSGYLRRLWDELEDHQENISEILAARGEGL